MMTAIELLKEDHELAMDLIERLEDAPDGELSGSSLELFGRLKSALTLHTFLEEQFFYHALANREEARDLITDAYGEHRKVDETVVKMTAPSNDWRAELSQLKAQLQHHVDEEENKIFPAAERLLGRDRLHDLGRKIQNVKQGKAAIA